MLHGTRYLRPEAVELAKVITHGLADMDLDETLAFYNRFIAAGPKPEDYAFLACNDRYFLLTGLCNRRDAINPWVFARCREVEASPDGYLDLWARYHYKSSVITFAGTIQEILRDPEITVGLFSFNKDTATGFLAQIKREFERNELLKKCFPDVLWDAPEKDSPLWSEKAGIILKRKGNPKEATVEGHGLVNAMPTGKHFKLLVYDDIITPQFVSNPEMVKKVTEAWELSDNLGTGEGTRKWHVGTRYSFGDTYQSILDRKILKARLYPATHNGLRTGNPVFMSPKQWAHVLLTQRSTVDAQMLQNPLAGSQATFLSRWFTPWEIRPAIVNVYIMGDPSRGRTTRSDRTALIVIGLDAGGNKYLLDGVRHRMSLSERWTWLRTLHRKWVQMPGVQNCKVGYERYGQQSDDQYFDEQMRKLPADEQFAIEELAWPREGSNSKQDRVQRLQPDVEGAKFFFPCMIRHPDMGLVMWKPPTEDDDKLVMSPYRDQTRAMRAVETMGQGYRAASAITRKDESNNVYDLTWELMQEMIVFPFGTHDDAVDACSRIYDLEPIPPLAIERPGAAQLVHAFDA